MVLKFMSMHIRMSVISIVGISQTGSILKMSFEYFSHIHGNHMQLEISTNWKRCIFILFKGVLSIYKHKIYLFICTRNISKGFYLFIHVYRNLVI